MKTIHFYFLFFYFPSAILFAQYRSPIQSTIQAEHYFEMDSLEKALNGDGKELGFLAIKQKYRDTIVQNFAKYYIGQIYLKQGKLKEGIAYLKKFQKGNNLVGAVAYGSLGAAYEDLGKNKKAVKHFLLAAKVKIKETEDFNPYFLLRAAGIYEDMGRKKKARICYKTIQEKYPHSEEATKIADKMLRK